MFYDDGDVEALDLATEVWRLEGQGGEARGAVKKGTRRPAAGGGPKKPTSPRAQVGGWVFWAGECVGRLLVA